MSTLVIRNRRRGKAHLWGRLGLEPSTDWARCGRYISDVELVPLNQTDPADRCRDCFPVSADPKGTR